MSQDTTLTLDIQGMDCGGCVRSVEQALRALPGIADVAVSLERHNAVIQLDPALVTREALIEAVEDAGFDVPR